MIWLIASAIIAVIMTSIATHMVLPINYNLHLYALNQNLTGEALQSENIVYNVVVNFPPIFVGAIFLALIMRAARKDQTEIYE